MARDLAPDYAIVGEPSSMRIISAHRVRTASRHLHRRGQALIPLPHTRRTAGEFIALFTDMADQWEEKKARSTSRSSFPTPPVKREDTTGGLVHRRRAGGRRSTRYCAAPQVTAKILRGAVLTASFRRSSCPICRRALHAPLTGAEPGSLSPRGREARATRRRAGSGTETHRAPLRRDAPQKVWLPKAGQFCAVQSIGSDVLRRTLRTSGLSWAAERM